MKTITEPDLLEWLHQIAQDAQLFAPRQIGHQTLYKKVRSGDDITLDYERPLIPVKQYLLPPTEQILSIYKQGSEVQLEAHLPEQSQVIFGVRPCDARAVAVLDELFITHQPSDTYYARRRENTTLIGLACGEQFENCFCEQMGGDPDSPQYMDLMLRETNHGYAIYTVTDKGAQLLATHGLARRANPLSEYPPPLPRDQAGTIPTPSTWPAKFNARLWEREAERCLSCRMCAHVCPTCRCFDVRDEQALDGNSNHHYDRLRCWDSCTGVAYRKIAGGHNPRADKSQRLRNRLFCKFYYYPEQYGPVACTGCGRCVEVCPVNIDVTEILDHLTEVAS